MTNKKLLESVRNALDRADANYFSVVDGQVHETDVQAIFAYVRGWIAALELIVDDDA